MPTEVTLPYNGLDLDRAPSRRTDAGWVRDMASDPAARAVVFWRDNCLVRRGAPVTVRPAELADPVFLGMDAGTGVFALDVSDREETGAIRFVGADEAVDIRRLFPSLDRRWAAILSYARGILHWNRNQRFCGRCGGPTAGRDAGHLRVCQDCGKLLFPRIEPAVIVLVEAPDAPARCLLARHRGAAVDAYSTLAGFVEIGEGLEDAVRRELLEEAGVRAGGVTYQASQSWPFPAGLMVGFRAVAMSDSVTVDGEEIVDARWFTREEVAARLASGNHRKDSIEHFLVTSWVEGVE